MNEHTVEIPDLSNTGARPNDYFGAWAIRLQNAEGLLEMARRTNWSAHVEQWAAQGSDAAQMSYVSRVTPEGIAIVQVSGVLMKHVDSLSAGTSTIRLRRALRALASDSEVSGVMLVIDSPGGTVAGTADLAAEVASLAGKKPVVAYIEDLGASAAYWAASQATKVYANATALVGSIGTYMVAYDLSGAAAMRGIRAIVVTTGEFKGAGAEGAEITDAQRAEFQRTVDALNEHFLAGVAQGRRVSIERVRELADGRVHIAAEAQGLGLIDGVRAFGTALQEIITLVQRTAGKPRQKTPQGGSTMPDENTTQAASLEELRAACPGASSDFLLKQIERKATVQDAMGAWIQQQQADNAALAKKNADLKAQADRSGTDVIGDDAKGRGEYTDAIATWKTEVAAKVKQGMSRQEAAKAVARETPDLREAYVAAYNEIHKQNDCR